MNGFVLTLFGENLFGEDPSYDIEIGVIDSKVSEMLLIFYRKSSFCF